MGLKVSFRTLRRWARKSRQIFLLMWIPTVGGVVVLLFLLFVIQENGDYANVARYFFSSVAQAMGALIAIVLTALYLIVSTLRVTEDNLSFEPIKRLLMRDPTLNTSIYCGFACIIAALLAIAPTATMGEGYNDRIILIFSMVIVLILGYLSLSKMLLFIKEKGYLYTNPELFLKESLEREIKNPFIAANIAELYLFQRLILPIVDLDYLERIVNHLYLGKKKITVIRNTADLILRDLNKVSVNIDNFNKFAMKLVYQFYHLQNMQQALEDDILIPLLFYLFKNYDHNYNIIHLTISTIDRRLSSFISKKRDLTKIKFDEIIELSYWIKLTYILEMRSMKSKIDELQSLFMLFDANINYEYGEAVNEATKKYMNQSKEYLEILALLNRYNPQDSYKK